MTERIILGIDPGSYKCGWACIWRGGRKMGVLTADDKDAPSVRLFMIHNKLARIYERFKPTHVAIEEVWLGKNPQSAQRLVEIRTSAKLLAVSYGCIIDDVQASEAKRAVTQYGAASKEQVQAAVKSIACMKKLPKEDAADAFAIAYEAWSRYYDWVWQQNQHPAEPPRRRG